MARPAFLRRRSRTGRRRGAGVAAPLLLLAKLLRTIGLIVFAVIAVGVLLVALSANEENAIVDAVLEVDRFFTDPFRTIFDLEKGKEHLQIAINWGIGAAVYLAVAFVLAGLLRALARRGRGEASA